MAISVNEYVPKLEKLLEKFSETNFEIENDVYLNTLLSHLAGKDNKELGESLRTLPLLIKWISEIAILWESNDVLPSQTIGIFAINLIGLLSQDKNKFLALKANDTYVRLIKVLKIQSASCNPSLKLGYIKLLSSFLNHTDGIEYVINTNYWECALRYCLSNQTIYIIKEGQHFIFELLQKTANNEKFSNQVIKEILSILYKNPIDNGTAFPEIKKDQLRITIMPTLQLIVYVLDQHFQSTYFTNKNNAVPLLFFKNNLKDTILQMLLMVQDADVMLELEKIMVMLYLLEAHVNCQEDLYNAEQLREKSKSIFQLIKAHLTKREVECIIKLSYWIQYFWHYMLPNCPAPWNEKNPLLFENQVLIMQTLPLYTVKLISIHYLENQLLMDDFRDHFITKIFKIMCESTIRMGYTFRSILMESDVDIDYAQLAVQYIIKSKELFRRETCIICFQGLLYNLKDIAHLTLRNENPLPTRDLNKYDSYMLVVIDAIMSFIKDYDFTWRESIETLCVTNICLDLLSSDCWSPKVTVRTLKLLNISIKKLMQPNLALLVDNTSGTTIEDLGPVLKNKLKDTLWDIRDTTLEVLYTIAEYSQTKFPSFQKIMFSCQFLSLITEMCMSDDENYVRASAIKCLQKMIQVSSFWYPHLENKMLPQKMIQILLNEPEGIVRCEAATLISDIYFYQSFQEDNMPSIYKIMSHAVISDLHWEVKYNALLFWEHVINNELKNQGMIDGSFPTVTFSTENKKIVTLTNAEIAKRLNKALNRLSKCGCLGVFTIAIMEDYQFQVSKRALNIVNILKDLVTKYNVKPESNKTNCGTSSEPTSPDAEVIFVAPKLNNGILEEILDSKDINLLDDIINGGYVTVKDITSIKELNVVHPDEFLNFIQKDLDTLINERERWLNNIDGLDSLLDDMLKTYNYDHDVNRMDCY